MQKLIKTICLLLVISAFAGCGTNEPSTDEPRPNIIFIMADDHAYQAISCYGDSLNSTPNIDKLAESGVRFNKSFCTNSICAPSRAVMLTGTYSHINGHIDNSTTFDGSQITFPKLLQKASYQTAMIGKWHLKSEPTGFDYWNILPGQGNYYNPDFIDNGVKKRIPGYVTDITTDIALDWMDDRDKEKPFCLLLHHKAPHRNWMPAPEYLNKYDSVEFSVPETFFDDYDSRGEAAKEQKMKVDGDMMMAYDLKVPEVYENGAENNSSDLDNWNFIYGRMDSVQRENWNKAYHLKNQQLLDSQLSSEEFAKWKYQRYMQDYLSCIASIDDNIGRVIDYLEKNNLLENTIIVYTSDQGFYLGEHGWFDKRFMYEQSLRMPLIISYPDKINPAVDDQNFVMNLDFAPTFLDYAGVEIPDRMQGKSLRNILQTDTINNWRDAVYYRYYEYPGPHSVKRHYGIRTSRYKLIHFYYDTDYWELYDLENDPHEIKNIYENEENKVLVNELKTRLYDLQKKYSDTEEDTFLPAGNVEVDHIAVGSNVTLKYPYNEKYSGGNKNALTDGNRSSDNGSHSYDYSVWQGFEGQNLEAIIDLNSVLEIRSISCGFLQNRSSWIFRPERVSFYISKDGNNFSLLKELESNYSARMPDVKRIEVSVEMEPVDVRYIKITAESIGICPDWHAGKGKKAWLFADEIVVE